MNSVKVAVVGAGMMGLQHCRAYSRGPMAELAAVVDVRQEAARESARTGRIVEL